MAWVKCNSLNNWFWSNGHELLWVIFSACPMLPTWPLDDYCSTVISLIIHITRWFGQLVIQGLNGLNIWVNGFAAFSIFFLAVLRNCFLFLANLAFLDFPMAWPGSSLFLVLCPRLDWVYHGDLSLASMLYLLVDVSNIEPCNPNWLPHDLGDSSYW